MSVNKVILVGRLGQNPEVRYTPAGAAVANFSVATNEKWVDKSGQKQERTEWHRVVVWGKQAELCSQYLTKGREVYLEGRLQTRQWQDKENQTRYTTEVQVNTVQFLGGNAGAGASSGGFKDAGAGAGMPSDMPGAGFMPPKQGNGAEHASFAEPTFSEDDIPF